MKKIIAIAIVVLASASAYCQPSNSAFDRTTCMCTPPPAVLIPAGGDTRVGWINIYQGPMGVFPASIPMYAIVDNHSTGLAAKVINPSTLGGLPVHFPGITGLSGISYCPTCSTGTGVNYMFSTTATVAAVKKHFLLTANKATTNGDFVVNNALVVTATFAPAASGWTLHHIESDGTNMYGLFSNSSTTYLATINMSTGTATSVWSSAACYNGLDVKGGHAYLLRINASTVVDLDLTSLTTTSTSYPLSTMSGCGGFNYWNYFLFYATIYGEKLLYNNSNEYRTTSSTPVATTMYSMNNWTTVSGTTALGFIICDAAH